MQIGRLALREEGRLINAYYAQVGTMDRARLLFSVDIGAAQLPGVREKILDLGRHIVGELITEITGVRPTWGGEERAPEHERAGNT